MKAGQPPAEQAGHPAEQAGHPAEQAERPMEQDERSPRGQSNRPMERVDRPPKGQVKFPSAEQLAKIINPSSEELLAKLMFRLLPLQILLAGVSVANDIVSSLFASNAVGTVAMAAVGFYTPVSTLILAVGLLLVGGTQILSGQYMGRNQIDRLQSIFMLGNALTCLFCVILIVLHVLAVLLGWTQAMTDDLVAREYLNQYMIGRSIGVLPLLLAMQLTGFLSIENQTRYTTIASIAFIVANLAFHVLFVMMLHMGAFGLVLASSLGSWVYLIMLAQQYFAGKSILRLEFSSLHWQKTGAIFKLGFRRRSRTCTSQCARSS